MIKFFTAAYGALYTETALRGLVRSFNQFNVNDTLIVYVDVVPDWLLNEKCDVRHFPSSILADIQNSEKTFFDLTAFKFSLFHQLLTDNQNDDFVWIDADSLVLGNMQVDLQAGKIGFINHGSCDDEEEFDCGNGLIVKGRDFAIGGIFHIPSKEHAKRLIDLSNERKTWLSDENAYWFNDGEQSLLNHLVNENKEQTYKINENNIYNWEFLENRHPYPFDKGLASIEYLETGARVKDKPIKLLCLSSLTLLQHSRQGYRTFSKTFSKVLRSNFYNGCPRLANSFTQMAFLLYFRWFN